MGLADIVNAVFQLLLPIVMGITAVVYWGRHQQSILKGFGFVFKWSVVRDFVLGMLITALAMVGIFVVELLLNSIQVTGSQADFGVLAGSAGQFFFNAALEELLFRSLLLSGLVIVLRGNKWLAILISAVVFGVIHITNPNASLISAFGNGLGGIIYGMAFLGAKNIWFPLGLHFAWNFTQALLGFPVSGQEFPGLFTVETTGSDLLTGGAFGPEAGLVGMVFRFVIMAMIIFYLSRVTKTKPGNARTLEYEL